MLMHPDQMVTTHQFTSQPYPWVLFFPADPRVAMEMYIREIMLVDGGEHSWLKSPLSKDLHLTKLTIDHMHS